MEAAICYGSLQIKFVFLNIHYTKLSFLPLVLYGCETWSLALGEEHRLSVFENRVLRKIFGPKREADG